VPVDDTCLGASEGDDVAIDAATVDGRGITATGGGPRRSRRSTIVGPRLLITEHQRLRCRLRRVQRGEGNRRSEVGEQRLQRLLEGFIMLLLLNQYELLEILLVFPCLLVHFQVLFLPLDGLGSERHYRGDQRLEKVTVDGRFTPLPLRSRRGAGLS